jgi:hypothetical protein
MRVIVQRITFSPIEFNMAAPLGAAFFFSAKAVLDGSMMLSGLIYWLSPARRRFMRRLARPGLDATRARLAEAGSPRAIQFISTILDANADFLAYALSSKGPLHMYSQRATPETVAACIATMLIYSVNMFARDEMQNNESEMIPLLAHLAGAKPTQVMLRRDALRKAPRSEEWLVVTWLARNLGAEPPKYDAELERAFGYNYLSYIDQYRPTLEREMAAADTA